MKRIFDVLFSGIIVIILFPICAIIAMSMLVEGLLIPKHRGPLFYTETRISKGKPFALRKFRIFKTNTYMPQQQRGEVVHTKPLERNPKNLTHVGRVLKNFYLDESPQLWNVLMGNMSLIGPRPWNPVDYENEIQKGEFRKKVIKAGLTGPVQVHKLDAKAFGGEHKLDYDYIAFVRSHSGFRVVIHDVALLVKSFLFMIRGQGL